MEIKKSVARVPSATPLSAPGIRIGSRRIEGSLALEYLGRVLVFSPIVGLLFTSFWSVGIALMAVVAPLTWLGRGGKMPVWMLADPETAAE